MIPVTAMDHHTLPAFPMVRAGLGTAAVIDTALPDLIQCLHLEFILFLRRHRLVLLPNEFLIVIDFRNR